ncbi:GntR family transcriptional regulator [Nocardioides hungaricus]
MEKTVPAPRNTQVDGVTRHLTLGEFVINELRQRIVLGELPAGSRLAVEKLAMELSSSRIPVREALRHLEGEGLVVNAPRRGVMVSKVSRRDVHDAYSLLESAELLAAATAINEVDEATLQQMDYWVEEMLRLRDRPKSREMLAAHRAFHFAMFDSIGPGLLLRHINMLWNACERYVVASMIDDDVTVRGSVERHKEFITHLKQRDLDSLTDLIRRHLHASRERAYQQLAP